MSAPRTEPPGKPGSRPAPSACRPTPRRRDLLATIQALNDDPAIDGILVQLPLPAAIDPQAVIEAIDPAKDVDGFHPMNVGHLADGRPALVPCTPLGVMKLLRASGVEIAGARAVIAGPLGDRRTPDGPPAGGRRRDHHVAHSRTRDLPAECRRADILIAAVGKPEMVQGDWIRPGATVIDVGINRLPDGRLVGDVAFAACAAVAGAITPVPGGVGPMTVACLLENTLTAAMRRRGGSEIAPDSSHQCEQITPSKQSDKPFASGMVRSEDDRARRLSCRAGDDRTSRARPRGRKQRMPDAAGESLGGDAAPRA